MAPFQKLAVRSCARAVRLYITSSMQLAGFSCCFCDRSVVLYSDATGCSGCKSVAHKTCLSVAGHLCPQCTTSWRNFEDGIACSQRCPCCGEHFSSSQVRYCIKCGTQTSWDTREEYLAARHRIRRLGAGSAALGTAGLLASMPCLAVSTSIVWGWHRMFPQACAKRPYLTCWEPFSPSPFFSQPRLCYSESPTANSGEPQRCYGSARTNLPSSTLPEINSRPASRNFPRWSWCSG